VDPDADAVQGFHDQNLEKFTTEKNSWFFDQKLQFFYPYASIKNVQATREAFSPQ
jgi:hypothetical protein